MDIGSDYEKRRQILMMMVQAELVQVMQAKLY